MKKIVVVGSSNMDIIISVPHIPIKGETILANGVSSAMGGKGANQASAIAKLGGNIYMIGALGKDSYGEDIYRKLKEYGVNVSGIELSEKKPTGNAYINVSAEGDNNIVVNAGANNLITPEYLKRHENIFKDAEYCISQMEIPLETIYYLSDYCAKNQIKHILNPAPAQCLDFARLANTYIIAPNESELDILIAGDENFEKKAAKLYEFGIENVLVTIGSKGCVLVNKNGLKHYDAFKVENVVDTTAAGDSFIGALTYALADGSDFDHAIHFATIAAAITVTKKGAQPSLPNLEDVKSISIR